MKEYQIKYDPRFTPPGEDVIKKLILSQREYEALEKKPLKCPICGFPLIGLSADRHGIVAVKCQKCKFEGPINLAYFRTQRYRHYHLCWSDTKQNHKLK